jgi:hypothetical protein
LSIRENVDLGDRISAKKSTKKVLHEQIESIHGFVTVTKNIGREDEQVLCLNKHNLLTQVGRDDIHNGMYANASGGQSAFNYMAVTSSTVTPATNDTTLDAEITTGGLIRIQATTRTHTVSTNTTLIEQTFTATATFTAVQASGIFDAVTTGTMGHENTFTPANLEIDDTLTVSWTITAG